MKPKKPTPKVLVKQADKGAVANMRCHCGGIMVRDQRGRYFCKSCRTRSTETPL
mgnify:CR=1 FL=1